MDSPEEDPADEERVEDKLFALQSAPCICRRITETNDISSWQYSSEKKAANRKRAGEPGSRTQTLLRRGERSVLSSTDGFVFRHYEDTRRYIEQYREIHASTCAETEVDVKPVLGIDLPDPYLPKIGTSGNGLIERLRIIEAMSDYYRVAATKSDINNICLTGRRAETASRTTRPTGSKPAKTDHLPIIKSTTDDSPNSFGDALYKGQGRESDNLESLSFPFVTEVELPRQTTRKGGDLCKDVLRKSNDSSPYHYEWKISNTHREKPESISFGKSPKNSGRVRDDPPTNAENHSPSKLAAIGRAQDVPRKPARRDAKASRTPRQKRVQVGKCEVFSSSPRQSKSRKTRAKFPSETAFIRILGQATGPPPKDAAKDITKNSGGGGGGRPATQNGRVPVQLLGRFGGRFQHVLEARAFKPADGNLPPAAVANVQADYY